ncbi:MAG: hypothetical protein ACFFDT_08700, partial [Candidatus Hodarchaeota archaeon]
MRRSKLFDKKPREIIYFVAIELVIAFLGVLLAIISFLTEPSSELQGITSQMNILLTLLDLFGGISLGTILGLLQSLLIQNPALFLLTSSVVALLFSGINFIVAWFLWTLKTRTYSLVLLLTIVNISLGLFGMPREFLHLPVGIGGLAVNFAMILVFNAPRMRELFSGKPIHHIRLAATSQFLVGISLLFIGLNITLLGQEPRSIAQTGVYIFGSITGFVSILVALGLWTLRNGSYIQSISLALTNTVVGILQWPYGVLVLSLSLFSLYNLLQPMVQEEFQITQKIGTILTQVLEAIIGSSSVLAGISSAYAGFTGQSGASIIGGSLAVLSGLVLLLLAWETHKYGVKNPRLALTIILATFTANLIELGLDSFYQTPLGVIEKEFGVIVLIACTVLLGISTQSGRKNLIEIDKDHAIWFSLFASIAMLLHIVYILSPEADVVSFSVDTAIYMGIFGILAISLNVEAGQTGLMNFGKVA